MYGNSYMRPYNNVNQQSMYDQIDNEINNLQQMKEKLKNQMQQPTAINQTFQISPTNNHSIRYAETIDDVNKEVIYFDTPFFSKDMSVLWIKSVKGDIKTYELNEIIPKDSKDLMIESLQEQLNELKGMIKNDANVTDAIAEQDATDTSRDDESVGDTTKSEKSTGFSKISRSKKEQ